MLQNQLENPILSKIDDQIVNQQDMTELIDLLKVQFKTDYQAKQIYDQVKDMHALIEFKKYFKNQDSHMIEMCKNFQYQFLEYGTLIQYDKMKIQHCGIILQGKIAQLKPQNIKKSNKSKEDKDSKQVELEGAMVRRGAMRQFDQKLQEYVQKIYEDIQSQEIIDAYHLNVKDDKMKPFYLKKLLQQYFKNGQQLDNYFKNFNHFTKNFKDSHTLNNMDYDTYQIYKQIYYIILEYGLLEKIILEGQDYGHNRTKGDKLIVKFILYCGEY